MLGNERIKLNFVIPDDLAADLAVYRQITGRSSHEVVRQLVAELLEGDRLRPPPHPHPEGARTSIQIPHRTLETLESFTSGNRHPTKAALIAALLRDFLKGRVDRGSYVTVGPLQLPTTLFDKLRQTDGPGEIEDLILARLQASFKSPKEAPAT